MTLGMVQPALLTVSSSTGAAVMPTVVLDPYASVPLPLAVVAAAAGAALVVTTVGVNSCLSMLASSTAWVNVYVPEHTSLEPGSTVLGAVKAA
jgi:hypothetical protein